MPSGNRNIKVLQLLLVVWSIFSFSCDKDVREIPPVKLLVESNADRVILYFLDEYDVSIRMDSVSMPFTRYFPHHDSLQLFTTSYKAGGDMDIRLSLWSGDRLLKEKALIAIPADSINYSIAYYPGEHQ